MCNVNVYKIMHCEKFYATIDDAFKHIDCAAAMLMITISLFIILVFPLTQAVDPGFNTSSNSFLLWKLPLCTYSRECNLVVLNPLNGWQVTQIKYDLCSSIFFATLKMQPSNIDCYQCIRWRYIRTCCRFTIKMDGNYCLASQNGQGIALCFYAWRVVLIPFAASFLFCYSKYHVVWKCPKFRFASKLYLYTKCT